MEGEEEKVSLHLPDGFFESLEIDAERRETSPKEERTSEDNAAIASMLHAVSNKGKTRDDVDDFKLMNELSGKRADKGEKASNLFQHLKNITDNMEKEEPTPAPAPYSPLVLRKPTSDSPASRRKTPSPRKRRSPSPRRSSPARRRSPRESPKGRSSNRSHHREHYSYGSDSNANFEEKAFFLQSWHILQAQGVRTDLKLDVSADIVTIKTEVHRMQTELNSQKCIKFARKALIALVSGVEFANTRYDPFGIYLNGWSEHVMTTLGDYDSVFLRLYDKYKDVTGVVAPELELLLLLGGSAFMFHLTHSFVNQAVPSFQKVAEESPDLANKVAEIMARKYEAAPKADSPPSSDDESVTTEVFTRTNERVNVHRKQGPVSHPPIPTELLHTPAFPALIQKMQKQTYGPVRTGARHPGYNANGNRRLESIKETKEIDVKEAAAQPLPKDVKSENVLVFH
tara:strand:- start:204 stop:1571 length:1368 start_codon:yes stop_codon:yes gene_type:complete